VNHLEVREDETDGGYNGHALGYGIHTQAETLEELRAMVRERWPAISMNR